MGFGDQFCDVKAQAQVCTLLRRMLDVLAAHPRLENHLLCFHGDRCAEAPEQILPPGRCNCRRRLAQPDQRHHNSYYVNDGTEVNRTEVAHPVIVEVSHPMHW